MRFHIGYSFRLKTLLKWVLPIIVGLGAFFGIANIEVLAFETPINCQDSSSLTDYISCNIQGYYTITNEDISNQCNIYLGDSSTLNWRTRQVEVQIDYDVKSSEIGTTYDSNLLTMQQTSRQYNGANQSNFAIRFKRDDNDSPLYLSYTTYNMTSDTCQNQYSDCPPPVLRIFYCKVDTYDSCYKDDITYTQSVSNEKIGDLRFTTYKNIPIKTNAQIKQQYSQTDDYDYVQINFSNMPNSDSMSPPPLNSGWNYSGVLLSSRTLGENESPTDNEYITNYCKNTGGDFIQTGGNGSVTDEVTQAIHDTLTGPNGVLLDPSLPNISIPFFDQLIFAPTNIQGLLMFPLNMLNVVVSNMDTCSPVTFNLSSITSRWGGSDYVLTLPCIRSKIQSLLGNWYTVFDTLIAGILFYYFCSNLILKINDLLSGVDSMPYFYSSSSSGRTTRPSLADITAAHGHKP